MSPQVLGLVIGGLLPAIFFGLFAIFSKSSNSLGIALGYYLLLLGLAVVLIGFACLLIFPDRVISFASGRDAFLSGCTWAIGSALVAIALSRYHVPISQLVPLYNMNTLVAVLLGLWIFSEWQDINFTKLFTGSLLIIIGGTLVAWA